jgi:hypothetical protein
MTAKNIIAQNEIKAVVANYNPPRCERGVLPRTSQTHPEHASGLFHFLKKSLLVFGVFMRTLNRYSSVHRSHQIANQTLKRSSTMKRILTALIASVALFAAASGAAHAAAPAQCNGPASYCNVFFGN